MAGLIPVLRQESGDADFYWQHDALVKAAQPEAVEQCFDPLVGLFRKTKNGIILFITPETLSKLFHGNVMTSAKIHAEADLRYDHEEVINIAKLLWNGMTYYSQGRVGG